MGTKVLSENILKMSAYIVRYKNAIKEIGRELVISRPGGWVL